MGQHNESGPEGSPSVDEVLAEYLRRVDAGEAVDREAFLRSHPEAAEALRSYFDGAELVERLARGETDAASGGRQPPGTDSSAVRQSLGSAETIAPRGLADSWEVPTGPFGSLPAAFGRYRVEKQIGRGAMGCVYLARDSQLDRPVALKVPRLSGHEEADVLERFLREARAAANLTHPNICRVFDVGVESGVWFIAMEFVDGRPLAEFIVPGHLHDEKRCVNVVRKLAQALDEAHAKGIIHRDLKPANILINQRGEPILMDFGLARLADSSRDGRATRSGMILGSPAYMSPEQANGEMDKIGPQSDIYSLGVLLYELLTCQLPFQGSVLTILSQIATKEPPLPSSLRPSLDLRLEAICLKMMAKQRAHRFALMSEVERELTQWLASAPATAAASPTTTPESGGREAPGPVVFFESVPNRGADAPRSPASRSGASGSREAPGVTASAKDSIGGLLPIADKSATAKKSTAVTADDVAKQKQRVLKLLAEHNLATALPLLEKLAQQTGPVFQEVAAWAKSELPPVRERHRKLQEQNATACTKARPLLEKQDYSAAAALLDRIPAAARTPETNQLLSKASELYDEYQGLLTEIEEAIRRKKYDRLLPIVRRYLKLKPDSPKLERLARDLATNRPDRAVAQFKDTRKYFDVAGRLVEPKEVALSAIAILALFAAVTYGVRSYLANSQPSGNGARPDLLAQGQKNPVSGASGSLSNDQAGSANSRPVRPDAAQAERSDAGATSGQMLSLFNGRDLTGWTPMLTSGNINNVQQPTTGGWKVENSELVCDTDQHGWLRLDKKYSNFELSFEFFMPADSNSGVLVRLPDQGKLGPEIQLEDDPAQQKPEQATGALYNLVAPSPDTFRSGQWNQMTITCDGDRLAVNLNTQTVVDTKISSHPTLADVPREGHIGLSNWRGKANGCRFRNVRVKELSASTQPIAPSNVATVTNATTARSDTRKDKSKAKSKLQVEPSLLTDPTITNSIGMKLMLIPPGKFLMGAPDSDGEAGAWQKPQHPVRISQPFYIGVTEVTVGQFRSFVQATGYRTQAETAARGATGYDSVTRKMVHRSRKYNWKNVGWPQDDSHPVVNVSWNDAVAFCRWLRAQEVATYRLPTEAEWEYACRAGTTTRFYCGNQLADLAGVANIADLSLRLQLDDSYQNAGFASWDDGYPFTASAGRTKPNAFGLYDMHGNVWEWCADFHDENYYSTSPVEDPPGPTRGTHHIVRGGSWWNVNTNKLSSSYRDWGTASDHWETTGFRVVRVSAAEQRPVK